jgi:transitional endoplasmic reticulum ATPase
MTDDALLASLLAAMTASPDNSALRFAVVRACAGRGDVAHALEVLGDRGPEGASVDDRTLVAGLLVDAGEHERALRFAAGDSAGELLARARAHLGLGDHAAGRAAYQAAVAANPTLEDRALREALAVTVTEHEAGGAVRLRVIANDDTDDSEVKRLLSPQAEPVTFADVGGLDTVKEQIERRIILPFQKPALFARFRKRAGGGILLYGPPGCGKTLLARATAGQCKATFLNVAIEEILDMWIGESERKLHAIFEKARQSAPAVLFFDELEALAGKRQYTREATSSKLVSQFLSEMDGFAQNNSGVLVLGATNVPWAIDPAFRRPGRFDRVLFVPPPDRPARAAILQLHLAGRPLARNVDVAELAQRTPGFSGADLENLIDTGADAAIRASLDAGSEVPISATHLRDALGEVRPSTNEWLSSARNYARYANEGGQYDEVLAFLARHSKGG